MDVWSIIKNKIILLFYKLLKKKILNQHHISRFLRPSDTDDDDVLLKAFLFKRNDNGELKEDSLSVNWLEFFHKKDKEYSINEIRKIFSRKYNKVSVNAKLSVLNVENICKEVKSGTIELKEQVSLLVKHTPEDDDFSHSSIEGIPLESESEILVARILAECATKSEVYKAKL
jgi:hypothetical protein